MRGSFTGAPATGAPATGAPEPVEVDSMPLALTLFARILAPGGSTVDGGGYGHPRHQLVYNVACATCRE